MPSRRNPKVRGIRIHRRDLEPAEIAERDGIPVTSPLLTLIDIAAREARQAIEDAVANADRRDLIDPETLRAELDDAPPRPGVGILKRLLDELEFATTDSALERRFLALVRKAGLPEPLRQQRVNGFRVDFYWPDHGLVVETDGLRYHRTPAQQARDRLRDQAHVAAGLAALRFTRAQVARAPKYVVDTLVRTVRQRS